MLSWLLAITLGYLMGTIPIGVILGRLTNGLDVREHGSGRMGATNVFRIVGARAGLVVFVLDLVKGALIGLAGQTLTSSPELAVATAIAGIVGHNFPAYLRFRGGRGVLTYFGSLFVFAWPVALFSGILAVTFVIITRYASLGSVVSILVTIILAALLWSWGQQQPEVLAYCLLGGGFVIFQHRDNIGRLLSGRERKVFEGRRPLP